MTLHDAILDRDEHGNPEFFDLDRLDLTPANMIAFLAQLDAYHLSSTEDNADLYHSISVIFNYISADMLDDVYNADDPDAEPDIRDTLDQLTTELHIALASLCTFSTLDTSMLTN